MTIGELIRNKRRSKCISVIELAEMLFVAPTTIYAYETNKKLMPLDRFFEIIKILDLEWDDIKGVEI